MKLFFCLECHDIVRMFGRKRSCMCRKSWGCYTDDVNATIGGEAVPLGIDNGDFVRAIHRRNEPRGLSFEAFVIGTSSDRVTRT